MKHLQKHPPGLGGKFISMVVIILFVTTGTTLYVNYSIQKNNFLRQIETRGRTLGNFVAMTSADAVLNQDFLLLNQFMREISHQPDMVFGVILSTDNQNLTSYINRENDIIKSSPHTDFMRTISYLESQPDVITMNFPIIAADQIGTVKIGVSTRQIELLAKNALRTQLMEMSAIIIFLSLCIFLLFRVSVVKPVKELILGFKRVSEGELDYKSNITARDEFGVLAQSFNRMTDALKRIHEEKDRYVDALETSNEKLEFATRAKSTFLASMSHELRTPLNAIIGYSEMLAEDFDFMEKEEMLQDLAKVRAAARHLSGLINNVLDLSKIEAGKMELFIEPAEIKALFTDISATIKPIMEKAGVHFIMQHDESLGVINTDSVKLKQVLINLLSNAAKFSNNGDVLLSARGEKHGATVFVVRDNGLGMTETELSQIFNDYQQAPSTAGKYGGTGLGLVIVKSFVELMGGTIEVKSKPGQGTEFTISLPG